MFSVTTTHGRRFDVADHETILDAALRANLNLPYSCRTGRCSTCKGWVQTGETIPVSNEESLTESEKNQGWILTCSRRVASDVTIDIEDLGDFPLASPQILPCRISGLTMLAHDVVQITLRLPPKTSFVYLSGQYIDVIGPSGIRRSYSIANAPRAANTLELHVRRVDGGLMSKYWFDQAQLNDLLRLNGPLGTFFLRDVRDRDVAFLATGTGIAPVKAMLEQLARQTQGSPRSVVVHWGGRARNDFYWDTFETGVRHKFEAVLSRPDNTWEGARGYVQQSYLSQNPSPDSAMVYACGSDAMIRDAKALLLEYGVDDHRFFSDAFVPSGPT